MELLNFINTHENWEKILSEKPYCIKVSRDEGYILLKYDQLNSDFSDPIVRECRGCIIRQNMDGEYIFACHPFDKFGNYGESYAPKLKGNLTVLEKVDGSLIKCWWDRNRFHISTNGTIDAYKAPIGDGTLCESFGELVERALLRTELNWGEFMELCEAGYTWMFELVSPLTRVVVPYEQTELFLLGRRNMETGMEEDPYQFNHRIMDYFKVPQKYEIDSLEQAIRVSDLMDWTDEGFVIHDENFNRVKVKSVEYVKAHFLRGNGVITRRRLIEVVRAGEVEEFLTYCGDYKKAIHDIQNYLHVMDWRAMGEAHLLEEFYVDKTPREIAEYIKSRPKFVQTYLFSYWKKPALFEVWAKEKTIYFIERLLEDYIKEFL